MSLLKEYVAYIQDNPERYWFKRKLYGFGWVPANKQGGAVLVTYVTFVVGLSIWAEKNITDSQAVSHVIVPVVLATLALILITYRTGEPLKWQWGKQDGK
jgi:hypothetical protein